MTNHSDDRLLTVIRVLCNQKCYFKDTCLNTYHSDDRLLEYGDLMIRIQQGS